MPREVAWRIFAREFNSATDELRGDGEYSPNYILTPLGARVNRVLLAGTLVEKEQRDLEESFFRLKIDDRTGNFYVSVGQYQPEALKALREIEPPCSIMVVGKARAYVPEEGRMLLSLRPEVIHEVGRDFVRRVRLEASTHLKQRLDLLTEVGSLEDPTLQKIIDLGGTRSLAEGILEAHERYGRFPVEEYRAVLRNALYSLLDEEEEPQAAMPAGDYSPGSEHEAMLLAFLQRQDAIDGVSRGEIIDHCAGRGVDADTVITVLNALMSNGAVYQPSTDRFAYVD